MDRNYYEDKIKQVEAAIEANEAIDLDTTILYALKHEYEEALKEFDAKDEGQEAVSEKEDHEMSPFRQPATRSVQRCYEECTKNENNYDCMDRCNGCEHRCQFIHDHKGNVLINYPDLEVWVKIPLGGKNETT